MQTNQNPRPLRVLALAGSALCLLLATAADAEPRREPVTVHVAYRDLNLGSESGAKTMLRRIHRVAEQACIDRGSKDQALYVESRRCRGELVDKMVRELDAPHVTAAHHRQAPPKEALLAKR